jgi:branched-chain amino acid transport system substrate-binding protein
VIPASGWSQSGQKETSMGTYQRIGIVTTLALGLLAAGCSSDVKIGAIVSETGAVASYGEKVKKGLELALEEINSGGGLDSGGKVIIVYKDDATIPERGKQVIQELIDDDGVNLVIGAISSRVTLAIAPMCEKERVLLFSPSSSAPEISRAGDYVYRNYPSDIREGTSMAKFAKDLGLERIVIFAMDDDFGRGLRDVFTQQYESRFRQVVESFEFQEGDAAQFPDMISTTKEVAPDGIYVVAYQNDLSELLPMMHEAGIESVLMASSAVTPDVVRLTGAAAENLVYPQSFFELDSQEPAVASFVNAYRKKYGDDPDIYSAHGYDALKLLIRAINNGGGAHPDDVRIGLNGIHDYEGAAGKTTFDKNGDGIRHPRILIIRNGRPIPYEQFVEEGGSILARS